jgi:hypothetical protein
MENLTGEQQKRIALLEAFEAKTAPERDIRNAGIDQHEQEYREKWLQLQSSMEATRGDLHARLKGLGASDQSISSSVAIELAKLTEGYYAQKDKAARELDGTLTRPQSWLDFLKESKLEQPNDPIFDSLIEEAEKAPDSGLDGFTKQTAPNMVLADLQAREGKDGVMEYTRGLTVALRDVGARLDKTVPHAPSVQKLTEYAKGYGFESSSVNVASFSENGSEIQPGTGLFDLISNLPGKQDALLVSWPDAPQREGARSIMNLRGA